MTNVLAIHSVGESLRAYLDQSYPASLRDDHPCAFRLISSGELATPDEIDNTLTLYLYRVTVNEHVRNVKRLPGTPQENTPLSVDLHFILTVWAKSAFAEHVILAWAMRQLQQHPILDRSSLSPEADWGAADFVQFIPAELSVEDMMRVWDALETSYRLSVSYIARVVRIDTDPEPTARRVVATRFTFTDALDAP
jgi:hypothetical protein